MEKETSCGGLVVYNKKLLFVFSKRFGGYSVPKGHVDPGETHMECAIREIKEETGLSVRRIGEFEKSITYKHDIFNTLKTVVLFLFESDSDEVMPCKDDKDTHNYIWADKNHALKLAGGARQKDIIYQGIDELSRMGKL
jgi:8-oxo-dGTP pyrophosphatase MutT (NUDIX family)